MAVLGLGLVFIAAYGLLIALATASIPARWPFKPRHRDDDPDGYRLYLIGTAAMGAVGALLLLVGLLR
jgi:hypothetical protein